MEPNFTFRHREATLTRPEPQTKFDAPLFPMTDTNQKQLGNTLWSIADQLRGAMAVAATVKESLTVQIEGNREVMHPVIHPLYL